MLGQVFADRYRVVRKREDRAGRALYLAEHLMVDRAVTIDIVETDHVRPAAIDQFLEDARTVARVGHENIVEIFNGGRATATSVFLAMESLEGTALSAVAGKDGPMLWDRAQGILLQIAAGLGAVHRHGVVHGDLTPDNVLLVTRAGRRDFVKLLDFGVARVKAAGADTDEGSFSGAPAYLAPELAHAGAVDHRVDVYALGCVAYELVTGRPPFVADSVLELCAKHMSETPQPPSALRPTGSLPAELDAVLLRALEKDPAKRWPDMAALGDALGRCRLTRRQSVRVEALAFAEQAGKKDAFEVDARRRHRVWSIASVVAAIAIAIGVLRVLTTTPGHVQISTVPADATLMFNGMAVAATSPVVLDAAPGRYTLVVSRAGYVTAQRTVE
ncbi:MAG TPA: serine/threonine-protein kinase, partial [Polyangia bacterium]|nr:serine/threonine-protein kinase [Polyangia bacterium]